MLAKAHRFHGHNSLKFVYTSGETVRSRYLSLKYAANSRRQESRLAVVVAKKIAKKSPERNRIRRRLYEAFRLQWPMIQPGNDMVVTIFDSRVADMTPDELNKTVLELLHLAKLYKR